MTEFRRSIPLSVLVCALALLAVLAPPQAAMARPRQAAEVDPAHLAMIGRAAPSSRVVELSKRIRVVRPAAAGEDEDVALFAALTESTAAGRTSYEGRDLTVDLETSYYGPLRLEGARVVLTPSEDGSSCRFEISGAPFGPGSRLQASGSIEWGTGPLGGDRLEIAYRLGDAPVEAVRAFLPDRIDPSFRGVLELHGEAKGVVGETTTEAAPATPLRGRLEVDLDWEILGRTAPVSVNTGFSIDDRMVRVVDGKVRWGSFELGLQGWFNPLPDSAYSLTASFADVDAHAVAVDWGVPEAWRPVATLSGVFTFKSKIKKTRQDKGALAYDASAPSIVVPGLGGNSIRLEEPRLVGNLLAINAEVAVSIRARKVEVAGIDLESIPVGIRWWRNSLSFSTNNTRLWGGESDGSGRYEVATHPEFQSSGRVKGAEAARMAEALVPDLDLDVDGASSMTFHFTVDAEQKTHLAAHASLLNGRLGGFDLFAWLLEALGKTDPALAAPELAELAPRPRAGQGTRIDKLFVELDERPDGFALGGLFARAGEFQVDGDGAFSPATGLHLETTVAVPAAVASRLVEAAPWLSSLRAADSALYVPVVIDGPAASPTLGLAAGYADLLARARQGEAVTAPGVHDVEHVGPDNLPSIPGAPVLDPY